MNCTHQNKEDRHARDTQRSVCHHTHNTQVEKDVSPEALPANVQHVHTMQGGEEGGQGRESVLQTSRGLRAATLHATGEEENEDIQRPACCDDTRVAMPCHAARTKEVTLGPASHSHAHPTVGATTMYKYVGGQTGRKEKQNSLKITKRNEAGHVGVESKACE